MIERVFPDIVTDSVEASVRFYETLFEVSRRFDLGWYAEIRMGEARLAFVTRGHPTIPAVAGTATTAGVLVSVVVADVDSVHDRAVAGGLEIVHPLRDEASGQRHFMTLDPNGLVVDVITEIAPSREFVRQLARSRRQPAAGG